MQTNSHFLLASALLCCFLMGCAGQAPKQPGEMPAIAEVPSSSSASASASTPSASANTTLPARAAIDLSGLSLLESTFKTQLNVNRLDELYATTRRSVSHIAIVSNCDLDVLKAFVAKGWAPVVLVQYGSKNHLWALIGYDDNTQSFFLGNPVTTAARNVAAADFEKEWATGSGKKCVLMTPGILRQPMVHSVLQEYLPATKAEMVAVRGR